MSATKELRGLLVSAEAKCRLLAFAMGFHERLGAQARVRQLLDKEMFDTILKNTSEHTVLSGHDANNCYRKFRPWKE